MAVMRELTTVLDFKTDLSGLKVYESSVERIKDLALEVGKMFGLYFAVDKIGEFIGETVKAGKEMNLLNIQIQQLARNGDDAVAAQEDLFSIAQNLGIAYKDIADTYRRFLVDSQDSKISQEELLTATDNVWKSLRVGRANAEQTAEAVSSIERSLRMGRVGPRQIGFLLDAPGLMQTLIEASGKTGTQLREMAKSGQITGEQLIEWLAKPSERLNKDWDAMPKRIDLVFTRISNQLARAASQVWKLTNGFESLGKWIWWAFSLATNAIRWFIRECGGLEAALQLVGIALALVVGPLAIRQIVMMTYEFGKLALASWRIWLPWMLIGAAIVYAAAMIQDFMYWWRGDKTKNTQFEEWLGPIDEFKKQLEDMPLIKFATAMKDLFSGNFTKGIEELKDALLDPKKLMNEILDLALVGIPLAFLGWQAIKFTGLISGLGAVKAAAETVAETVGKVKGGAPGAIPNVPGQSSLPLTGGSVGAGIGVIGLLGRAAGYAALGAGALWKYYSMSNDEWKDWSDQLDKNRNGPTWSGAAGSTWDFLKGLGERAWYGPESIRNSVPWNAGTSTNPASAPVAGPTIVVNPGYNISVTVQPDDQYIADLIQRKVQDTAPDLANQISRQIQDATPRTERATQ